MAYHPFRHLGLKFVALVLASLLWLTVAGEHVVERILRVPVEFRNIPQHLEVVGEPPDSVEVRLRGSSALLSRLQPGDVVAMVDLQQARPGSRLFPIRHEEVRVALRRRGRAGAAGYPRHRARKVGDPHGSGRGAARRRTGAGLRRRARAPQSRRWSRSSGPESRVKKIANATTEPVSVAGARDNVRDVVAVGLIDSSLRLTKPQNVTVIVDILPAPVERELKGVLVRARNLGSGLAAPVVRPGSVTLLVRGRREALAAVRGRHRRRFRRSCRPRGRPVQSSGSGRSFAALRGRRDHTFERRRHHQGDQVIFELPLLATLEISGESPVHLCPTDSSALMAFAATAGEFPLDHETVAQAGRRAGARDARRRPASCASSPGATRANRASGLSASSRAACVRKAHTSRRPGCCRRRPSPTSRARWATTPAWSSPRPTIRSRTTASRCSPGAARSSPKRSSARSKRSSPTTSWSVGGSADVPVERTDVIDAYIAHARLALPDPQRLGRLKIAIDTANGATTTVAPRLFEELGFDVHLLSASPDGRNINLDCGSTHPQNLQRAVVEQGCRARRRLRRRRRPRDPGRRGRPRHRRRRGAADVRAAT